MKLLANPIRKYSRRVLRRLIMVPLVTVVLASLGGCPEYRNSLVDAVDVAVRSLVVGGATPEEAMETAAQGVLNATLDLIFDYLRVEETTF